MDWRTERDILKRIVRRYLSLAVLADCAFGRSLPVRFLILWVLRRAEGLALDRIASFASFRHYCSLAERSGDSRAEARRLARLFREAARCVRKELRLISRRLGLFDAESRTRALLPRARHVCQVLFGRLPSLTSDATRFYERLDSS